MITKETITQKLLKIAEGGAATTIDIVGIMLTPRGARRGRYLSQFDGSYGPTVGERAVTEFKEYRTEYKRYHALLQTLEKQGLLSREGSEKQWTITSRGLAFLLKRKRALTLKDDYVAGTGATVVSYDIPERLRRERAQLRDTLRLMDFEQAHQSVWFGNKKVSKKFIEYLREHKLLDFVHIFEITKSGTLKKRTNKDSTA